MKLKDRTESFELPPIKDILDYDVFVEVTFFNGRLDGIQFRINHGVEEDELEDLEIQFGDQDHLDILRVVIKQAEQYEERYKKEKDFP